MNNLLEIQNNIIKYFSKKGIDIIIDKYNNLVWNHKLHYSNFSVILYFEKEYFDDFYTIRYHVCGASITYKKKLKTKTSSKNFCLTIYKNFLYIQKVFDEKAIELKIDTDIKHNYCIELTRYYSRLHHKIGIEVSQRSNENEIDIYITGYDRYFNHETFYSIKYKNNKYYLISKSDYIKKDFDKLKNSSIFV